MWPQIQAENGRSLWQNHKRKGIYRKLANVENIKPCPKRIGRTI